MAFIFDDNGRFSNRNWYYIQLIVEAYYEPGGTRYVINNVAYKDSQPENDNPFSGGSPRSYSIPNGRAGGMTGSLSFQSDSDSGWAFQFDAGVVPQTQDIWGAGSFTRWIQESDNPSTVTISASQGLMGSATASTGIKHVFRTSFDGNGGTAGDSFEDAIDGNSITLPNATRSGYDFDGWLRNGVNVGGAGSSYTVTSTETLVASWSSSIPDVNITNGIFNRTVRRGQSSTYADRIIATDKRSDHSSSGSDWALTGTYANYFSINSIGSNDYVGYNIPSNAPLGSFTLTLTAYGPSSQDTDTATITIEDYPTATMADTSLNNGRVGVNFNTNGDNQISGDSNTASITVSGSIPGVSESISGATATFSGFPTDYGSYTLTATPTNQNGDTGTAANISVTILDGALSWADQSLSTTLVTEGESYSDQVSVNSGPIDVTYSVSPGSNLPGGININSSTGQLTSSNITAEPGTYTFRLRATNGSNEAIDTQNLTLTVEKSGGFMKVWNGAAWVDVPAKVWNGASFTEGTVKVWNGAAWVDSFSS